jgi:hypothetical protein
MEQRDATKVMHQFADCISKKMPTKVRALLATMPDSDDQSRLVKSLVGDPSSCLENASKMRLTSTLFRGALAEALLKNDPVIVQRTAVLLSSPPSQSFDRLTAALANSEPSTCLNDEDRATLVGRWVAYCSVHENPLPIRALLATEAGSAAEAEALRALESTFSHCLLKGQTLTVDRLTMRALLAEALYNRVAAVATEIAQ